MQEILTPPADAAPPTEPPHALPSEDNRRNGKVAKLPKSTRDRINHMLEDGLTYANIIEQLGPEGHGLTLDNISQWKKGGYQDWLRDHFWRVDMRFRQESFTDMLQGAEPIQLPEAGLQVAVTGICELLRDLCQNTTDRKSDSDKYVRVANSLARLSRSVLHLQQYRDTAAKEKAIQLKRLDHKRDFSGTEREGVLDCADDLFGFKSARRLQAEGLIRHEPMQPSNHIGIANDTPEHALPISSSGGERWGEEVPSSQPNGSATAPSESPSQISNPEISNSHPPAPTNGSDPTNGVPVHPAAISLPSTGGEGRGEEVQIPNSEISNPQSAAPSQISNPEISNSPLEHCLECAAPLPPLLPNGTRPANNCPNCNFALAPPGTCVEPSIEQCPICRANLPRLLPNGQRPSIYCHHCTTNLPPPNGP